MFTVNTVLNIMFVKSMHMCVISINLFVQRKGTELNTKSLTRVRKRHFMRTIYYL